MPNKNYISGALIQRPPTFAAVTTGSDEYSVEFNDANASGLSWRGSRYEGKQLFTQELNKVGSTDISPSGSIAGELYEAPVINGVTGSITIPDRTGYGNSACAQKYTRNIYIGNAVVGMDNGGEDLGLLQYPGFSYIVSNAYYTINPDDTIRVNRLESSEDDFTGRIGFYRNFYEDFPQGSKCRIVINDTSIKTNLKDNYHIYYNGGQLRKILALNPTNRYTGAAGGAAGGNIAYITGTLGDGSGGSEPLAIDDRGWVSNSIRISAFSGLGLLAAFNIVTFNENIVNEFYTGSFEFANDPDLGYDSGIELAVFLHNAAQYRRDSLYKGDKKFFVTFVGPGPIDSTNQPSPIRTNISGSIPNGAPLSIHATKDLRELSTTELPFSASRDRLPAAGYQNGISGIDSLGLVNALHSGMDIPLGTSLFPKLNQQYIAWEGDLSISDSGWDQPQTPGAFKSGSIIFSKVDDSNPSILVNLPKNEHLKDGTGRNSFVILPENLHPHIKQNLTYYLSKAGIPLGVDTIPVVNNEFKKLR